MPGPPPDPGAITDPVKVDPSVTTATGFASLLFLFTPHMVNGMSVPEGDGQPEVKENRPELPDTPKDAIAQAFEILAAAFAAISQPQSAAVKLPTATEPGLLKGDVSATNADENPEAVLTSSTRSFMIIGTQDHMPAGTTSGPQLDLAMEKENIEGKALDILPAVHVEGLPSSALHKLEAYAAKDFPVSAPDEKIASVVHEILGRAASSPKAVVHNSDAPETPAAPASEIVTPQAAQSATPHGLSIADSQVAAHVDAAAVTPSEHSGFFSHDNNHGGNHETNGGGQANAQLVAAHPVAFQSVDVDRPAVVSSNHSWSAVIERLAAEISTHARSERQEISMRLEPPELGHVRIDLSVDGDRVQARITTEFAEAGGLIQSHLQDLREALQTHHLDLINVQVDLGANNFSGNLYQDGKSEPVGPTNLFDTAAVSSNESEVSAPQRVSSLTRGAVSVWA
jgi:hypothetical protein